MSEEIYIKHVGNWLPAKQNELNIWLIELICIIGVGFILKSGIKKEKFSEYTQTQLVFIAAIISLIIVIMVLSFVFVIKDK